MADTVNIHGLHDQQVLPEGRKGLVGTGGNTNTAVALTIPADTDLDGNALTKPIQIGQIIWSYSAAPVGGRLTVSDGATLLDLDITGSGPGVVAFNPPLGGNATTSTVTFTLAAGSTCTGKLCVQAWRLL